MIIKKYEFYKTDGSIHHSGLENELKMKKFLKDNYEKKG